MKAYLLALLGSLALVTAAPTEIQLQITVNDERHHAVRPLALTPGEIAKLVLVKDCAPKENWHKPCVLKDAEDNRWLGECTDRGSSGGDQYICIHYGLDDDGPIPDLCEDNEELGKPCIGYSYYGEVYFGGICRKDPNYTGFGSSFDCNHDESH